MQILYQERRTFRETNPSNSGVQVWQQVYVQVRKWTSHAGESDVVLNKAVMVDGEIIFDTRIILDEHEHDATYIREGIRIFDKIVAAHPFFSQQDLEAQEGG